MRGDMVNVEQLERARARIDQLENALLTVIAYYDEQWPIGLGRSKGLAMILDDCRKLLLEP